jgi:hypothetical protein
MPVALPANISADRKAFTAERRTRRASEKEKAISRSPNCKPGGNRNEPSPALEQNKKPPALKRDGFKRYNGPAGFGTVTEYQRKLTITSHCPERDRSNRVLRNQWQAL